MTNTNSSQTSQAKEPPRPTAPESAFSRRRSSYLRQGQEGLRSPSGSHAQGHEVSQPCRTPRARLPADTLQSVHDLLSDH